MNQQSIKIAIGCDHAGYAYKESIKQFLEKAGYIVKDFGTHSLESVDYPDYVHPLAESIDKKENDYGVLICGSGNGVAMTANKYPNVRAALCWKKEIAALARQHNDANVICLPARFVSLDETQKMLTVFLTTSFEGGRHQKRVNKISKI